MEPTAAPQTEPMNRLPIDIPRRPDAFLVGGCVRDLLLGRAPADYDVAVGGSPAEYAAAVADGMGARVVEIGKPGFRVWRVAAGEQVVDVSPFQGPDIEADLRRRDFTINALAIATAGGEVVDPVGGRTDLSRRLIRRVSDSAFQDDPVRLVRAFRFAAQLGYSIDPASLDAVRNQATLIAGSAGERIRAELYKLLGAEHHVWALSAMAATGLLTAIFPRATGAEAPMRHAVDALRQLEALLGRSRPAPDFTAERRVLLRLALVLQGLGPHARSEWDAVFGRLRAPRRDCDHLERLLTLRDLPMRLFETLPAPSSRDEVRFFLEAGDRAPDVLLEAAAWALADPNLLRERAVAFSAFVGQALQRYTRDYLPIKAAPAPLTGNDLMREFGLRPSPAIKVLLRRVEEERLVRRSFTRRDALEFVRQVLESQGGAPPDRWGSAANDRQGKLIS